MNVRALAFVVLPMLACIWDSDTLENELLGIPDAETLVVTGRWVRHGKPWYEKRVREIPPQLAADPGNLDLYDDLAVAHERLGDPRAALAVMERKAAALEKKPDTGHRYRLLANRGMFLARAGKYAEAVADLEQAVDLNPESHFNREKYQVALFRYLADAEKDPTLRIRENFLTHARVGPQEGWRGDRKGSLYREANRRPPENDAERPGGPVERREVPWIDAYTAVAGMFRAGSPGEAELYRTLGDLFLVRKSPGGGDLNLAWWAYCRAREAGHPSVERLTSAIEHIQTHWKESDLSTQPTPATFKRMRESEDRWLAAVHAVEVMEPPEPAPDKTTAAASATVGAPPKDAEFLFHVWIQTKWFVIALLASAAVSIIVAGTLRARRSAATPRRGRRVPGAPARPPA